MVKVGKMSYEDAGGVGKDFVRVFVAMKGGGRLKPLLARKTALKLNCEEVEVFGREDRNDRDRNYKVGKIVFKDMRDIEQLYEGVANARVARAHQSATPRDAEAVRQKIAAAVAKHPLVAVDQTGFVAPR